MAWTITTTPTKFAFIIEAYFKALREQNIYKKRRTPWKAIGSVLLKQDGFIVSESNLKALINDIRDKRTQKKIYGYEHEAEEMVKNYFT